MIFNKRVETIWREISLMLLKPIKQEIRPERNKVIENYLNHYKLILEIFRLSYVYVLFVYYSACALILLYASVLLIFLFIEVTGKYIG